MENTALKNNNQNGLEQNYFAFATRFCSRSPFGFKNNERTSQDILLKICISGLTSDSQQQHT
jgi:hypothetical protein